MTHLSRRRLLCLVALAAALPVAARAADECDPLDHPPDPEAQFDHTKLAHLVDMVGSYGFDLAGAVYALAIARDNGRVLAGGASRTTILWHPKAGRAMRETDVTDRDVTAVAFSPDSRTALIGLGLTGTEGYPIYLWDLITGNQLGVFSGHTWDITSVSYSHGGTLVLSSSRDGTARVWDPKNGRQVKVFHHPWQVLAAAFSPDDKLVLTASRDGQLFLWDVASGQQVRTFDGLLGPVRSIAFSADGTRVLGASDRGLLFAWDTATGQQTRQLAVVLKSTDGWPARFGAVAQLPDQNRMRLLPAHFALSASGEHLAVALADGTLMTWNTQTLKLEDPVQASPPASSGGGRVALSDDGRMAVEGFVDGRVRLRDLETHQDVSTERHVEGGLEKLVTSADGQRFFARTAATHELVLLDADLHVVHAYQAPGEARFEPSGKQALVALTDAQTGKASLQVVDAATGATVTPLIDSIYVEAFFFTANARRVQALFTTTPPGDAPKSILATWDAKSGRELKEMNVPLVGETMLTRDGKYALTSLAEGGMALWDLASGKVKRNIARAATEHQRPLAISPDGKLVATSGSHRLISVWSLESGDLIRAMKGHRCTVRGAAFTPDGKRLLSIGGDDEEMRLWDGATAEQVDAVDLVPLHDHPVSATFSNDGQSFLVATARGLLMKFDFDSAGATANSEEEDIPLPQGH